MSCHVMCRARRSQALFGIVGGCVAAGAAANHRILASMRKIDKSYQTRLSANPTGGRRAWARLNSNPTGGRRA